jgi:hypothetical protein
MLRLFLKTSSTSLFIAKPVIWVSLVIFLHDCRGDIAYDHGVKTLLVTNLINLFS